MLKFPVPRILILFNIAGIATSLDENKFRNVTILSNFDLDIEISSFFVTANGDQPLTASGVWLTLQFLKYPIGQDYDTQEVMTESGTNKIVDGIVDMLGAELNDKAFVLSCNASCPIQWRFYPAKEELLETFNALDIKILHREGDFHSSENRYLAHLSIFTSANEVTGKYVCECIENSKKSKEVYLFWEDPFGPVLVNAGKTLHKHYETNQTWLELPCGTSRRSRQPYLFVQSLPDFQLKNANPTTLTRIFPNASVVADQFSGFKLNLVGLNLAKNYVWICTPSLDSKVMVKRNELVYTVIAPVEHVTKDLRNLTQDLVPIIRKRRREGIDEARPIACCRVNCPNCTTASLPSVRLFSVSNVIASNFFKPLLHRSNTPRVLDVIHTKENCSNKYNMESVSCDCSSVRVPGSFKLGFIMECSLEGSTVHQDYYFNVSTKGYIVPASPDLPQNDTSLIRIHPLGAISRANARHVLRTVLDMYNPDWYQTRKQTEIIFFDYIDLKTGQPKNTESLYPTNPEYFSVTDESPEGEYRCYICEVSLYYFQIMPKWTIDWVNGTRTEDVKDFVDIRDEWAMIGPTVPPRLITSLCAMMELGVKSVSCNAALLASREWVSASDMAPKIFPTEAPAVTGISGLNTYMNDSVELFCTVNSRSPVKIEWFANDLIIQRSRIPVACPIDPCTPIVDQLKVDKTVNRTTNYTCVTTNFRGTDRMDYFYQVRETVPPRINGKPEETLEFYIGDTDQVLECSVFGQPRPNRILWKLNDIPNQKVVQLDKFNDSVALNEYYSISTYAIPVVSLNSSGTYKCTAFNRLLQKTSKIFRVNVSKSPVLRNIIILSTSVVVLIGFVFSILLRKYSRQNRDLILLEKEFHQGIKNGEIQDGRIHPPALPYTGEYEIEQGEWTKHDNWIGRGNFGQVHLGELRRFRSMSKVEFIAIKFLRSEKKTIENLQMLCSELKMMMKIKQMGSHPNIVNFIGAATKNFQKMEVYIIMEYCSLGNLKTYVTLYRKNLVVARDSVTVIKPIIAKWCEEIARGMIFLHNHNIIHIDLAARNVLLTSDRVAKVGDYGLSRDTYGTQIYKKKSDIPMPELYISLEALQNQMYSVQSDVWSYGITVWEVFSMGSDPGYTNGRSVRESLEDGERLGKPALASDDTYQILQNCWNADPETRPKLCDLADYFQILQTDMTRTVHALENGEVTPSINVEISIPATPTARTNQRQDMKAPVPEVVDSDLTVTSAINDPQVVIDVEVQLNPGSSKATFKRLLEDSNVLSVPKTRPEVSVDHLPGTSLSINVNFPTTSKDMVNDPPTPTPAIDASYKTIDFLK